MRIAITGGTGFIGSFLREELFKKEHEIIVPARRKLNISHIKTVKSGENPRNTGGSLKS